MGGSERTSYALLAVMIELRDISKTYRVAPGPGKRARVIQALQHVTLGLGTGEVIGVVGPNGAGKTTLFGLILGFLEASGGDVLLDGMDARKYVRLHGASYLPERFQLPRDWTVRTALAALLTLDKATRSVDDVLADFDLSSYATARAHTLSRGTMQRLGMAQAFANPHKLVVLDEPTEGLDPIWRVRLREEVRRLRSPERIIIVASHDLTEIERVADRVIILKDGRVADEMTLSSDSGEGEYAIVLTATSENVFKLFENARVEGETTYIVTTDGPADLSVRLAALIESGANIVSVTPTPRLEQRVTGTNPHS